ncbi:Putative nuclease HARBI1 [Linum perenne]
MQYVVHIMNYCTNEHTDDEDGGLVYRSGFLVNTTRTNDVNCLSMLRMRRRIFWNLVDLLKSEGGLSRTTNMEVDEMVAMFLLTIGHNAKNRTCQVLFHRSAEIVSRTIKKVLLSILNLQALLIAQPVPVPENCDNHKWKYLKDCLGAIDGTYVSVRTTMASQARYQNRKGVTAINILGVCNQNLQFVYYLAGWEGSAHDSRVLRDALSRPNGFRVPTGKYYLCDAGYTNARGFLAPYRGQRYHLQEWGANCSRTAEEYFNMKHSKARNVIECAFGILKMRWAMLRDTSWYSPRMVGLFFTACCLLHNFIRTQGGADIFEMAYIPPLVEEQGPVEAIDELPSYVKPSDEWTQFRHNLAQEMWATRGR